MVVFPILQVCLALCFTLLKFVDAFLQRLFSIIQFTVFVGVDAQQRQHAADRVGFRLCERWQFRRASFATPLKRIDVSCFLIAGAHGQQVFPPERLFAGEKLLFIQIAERYRCNVIAERCVRIGVRRWWPTNER